MKTLTKTENVKRWLESGKALRQHQAKVNWNLERLAPIIARLKERGMWIINIGKPGKHANYIMIERGPIKNLIIKGHILEVIEAEYLWKFSEQTSITKFQVMQRADQLRAFQLSRLMKLQQVRT
jgi:hypothetical protein